MYRRLFLRLFLSLLIAAFFLWLSVKHLVSDAVDVLEQSFWTALTDAVSRVSVWSLLLYALIFLAVHVTRIQRWQYLITPLGERDTKRIFRICAVGYAAIVILPLRLGEMVRPYMLARESQEVSMSAALGTAVVERVLDGLLITGLLFAALMTYSGDRATAFVTGAGAISAAVFLGTSLLLGLTAARRDWTVRMLRRTIGRLSSKGTELIVGLVEGFLRGVRVLRHEGVLSRFLLLTAVYLGLNGLGIAVLAQAFGIDLGYWHAYGVLAILIVGIMIPAGPGFFGNFQFFLGKGLLLFAATDQVTILAFGLTLNTIQFLLQVGFGVPFFFASQLGFRGMLEASKHEPELNPE